MRSRKDIQTQQGLVSLQGAERRRLRFLLFLLLAEGVAGGGRDCYGTRIRDGNWRGVIVSKRHLLQCEITPDIAR